MSHLNPNAPSFSGSSFTPPGHGGNNAGFNNNGGGGGMMPNERYGSAPMYDGYNPSMGGGAFGGAGGANPSVPYGPGGGYIGGGGAPHNFGAMPHGHRGNRQGQQQRAPFMNHNGMRGGGAGNLRNYSNQQPNYSPNQMNISGQYDASNQQQRMPIPQRMHSAPLVSGMNHGIGYAPTDPRSSFANASPQRNPMSNANPSLNQGPMIPGNVPVPLSAPTSASLPAGPLTSMASPVSAPSYVATGKVRVVMVVGYKKTGKTTVAKAIASNEGFEYISLKSMQAGVAESAEEEEDDVTPVERLAPLRALLERKGSLKGIVIDDAFSTNKYHVHYIVHYLTKAGLQLDLAVALVPELSILVERKVSFQRSHEKRAHPEAFEFASGLDAERVVVIDEDMDMESLARKVVEDVSTSLKMNDQYITLEEEHFIPNCPMVTDPERVEKILAAERVALKRRLPYNFTYSEPNFVLDYVQFVQSAAKLQHYLVTPWIWGDKVSLIGHDADVYVHLTSYNLLFQLNDVPTTMQELMKKLKSEAEALPSVDSASGILFSVEASMLDDVIYISDMLLIGQQQGSEMLLHDRVKLLTECFGKLPSSGSVRLLEHYPVSEIKTCLEHYKDVSRGAIFVNPDGVEYGRYDVHNFVYPSENKKTVRLRIWAGSITDGTWSFEAYVREYEDEVLATSRTTGSSNLPVLISDANVDTFMINDGNIIECVMERTNTKGKSREKGALLNFCRRCKWEVTSITQFYMWAFADPPLWSTESFLDACSTIPSVRPTV